MLAIITSFVMLSACFSGYIRKFESFLWFIAFAASTGATAALLASVSVSSTHPGTLGAALVPFGVCFVCGFVLKEIRQSYEPELQRLKEAKYRFKAL
jgi:hypothetical protein